MARSGLSAQYGKNVFLNCPFDDEYSPIFRAIVFTIAACGYRCRCTLEHEDASQVRITKILRLIEDSALSIHDVSRTELDAANQLPRFNMPLELGAFLGALREGVLLPGGAHLCAAYDRFTSELPRLCAAAKLDAAHLTFTDFSELLEKWLRTIR